MKLGFILFCLSVHYHWSAEAARSFVKHSRSNSLPQESYKVWWPAINATHSESSGAEYTYRSYPSPFVSPVICGLSGVDHAWFCDPDELITEEEKTFLESRLLKLRDTAKHRCKSGGMFFYQAAVAVANKIAVPDDQTVQQAADNMAAKLLRKWGIGNAECHDGILLLYVREHNTLALQTREGVEPEYISEAFVKEVQHRTHADILATGSVGRALSNTVELLNSQLPVVHAGLGWVAVLLLSLAGAYILSVVIVYVCLHCTLTRKYASDIEE